MGDNTEIKSLLQNIQKGLRLYSVTELNDALEQALIKKHEKTKEIDYVLTIVSNEYNISQYALKNMKKRGNLQDAKQLAYCLLHFNLGLSIRYIANSIFFCWHSSVANGVARFKKSDIQHKQDRAFLEKYELLKNKLLNFVKEQTQKESVA
jgi:chromosomal replication initiation ATPase DnaA